MQSKRIFIEIACFFMASWVFLACQSQQSPPPASALFSLLNNQEIGIDFVNNLVYDEEFNVYTYRNFYNGAGIGIGDINNDGLPDLYFCGNMHDNKLYLNKGDFQFEDITEKAGVACPGVWSTGVSMVDINGDGLLDIYVCKSGDLQGENRHNELFINNGDLTFTEMAADYGINDIGLSTHAAFFDYDQDGDLDVYLLNNSFRSVGGYDIRPGQREIRDPNGGNKLYRNDGGQFTDVSEQAGIYGSAIGFGLGVTIGDVNRDGWQDIYVSNDFFEKDYLYLNNQDGTFSEALEEMIREISLGSMGADMADINNDGFPEIFVTDMLPEDDARMKTKTAFENWDKYQLNVRNGYYHQFTRNALQLNRGYIPSKSSVPQVHFSEISRFADVHATDWSWGALIADFDNDGWKDIFVANGIYKDLTDQDYINFMADPNTVKEILKRENAVLKRLIDSIPSEQIPNYAFRNLNGLNFENMATNWGLAQPSHSHGSAYADLDNDGDLDLVVNNVNMPPFVYRNETRQQQPNFNFLKVNLKGTALNTQAIGAQVTLYARGKKWYQELLPMRGFQSTVDSRLLFGLGETDVLDSLLVIWPQGSRSVLLSPMVNQTILLDQQQAEPLEVRNLEQIDSSPLLFHEVTSNTNLSFQHQENDFSDFDRDRLLYHMLSAEGPALCIADFNADGLDDFYVGGAKGFSGAMYWQLPNGEFRQVAAAVFEKDQIAEDVACACFDANGDGLPDLYVASGGSEFSASSSALVDRLYFNLGDGKFERSAQMLPVATRYESTACVAPADYDQDGDIDLFVGTRLQPFAYGIPVNGYLLENDGSGQFTNVSAESAPALEGIGLLTDAKWVDVDADGDLDLLIAGEWMPVSLLINQRGHFKDFTSEAGLANTNGFWSRLAIGDLNGDGLPDFVAGNHGLNTRFKATAEKPVTMYVNDFDRNGATEQVITVFNGQEAYPLVLRHDLIKQLPHLKKKYLRYELYKEQTIEAMFSASELENAAVMEVFQTASMSFLNQGEGKFIGLPLPVEAQLAPVYGLMVEDFDGDGRQDVLLGGNFYWARPETGIYDASYGLWLKGDGNGHFSAVPAAASGFFVKGQIKRLAPFKWLGQPAIVVGRNNEALQIWQYQPTAF